MKAFPVKGWNGHEETINEGMDLRDYFAIRFAETQIKLIKDAQFDALETFKTSYKLADLMMKAREK